MTPKEKAQELVERFREYSHTEFISYRGGYQLDTQIQNAKQCALIAVGEILNIGCIEVPYWLQVKSEIQAL
jgi:hypothetical protein